MSARALLGVVQPALLVRIDIAVTISVTTDRRVEPTRKRVDGILKAVDDRTVVVSIPVTRSPLIRFNLTLDAAITHGWLLRSVMDRATLSDS